MQRSKLIVAACVLAGCTGDIAVAPTPGSPDQQRPDVVTGGRPGGGGTGGATGGMTTTPPEALRLPSPTLRRLTVRQIQNALGDLFGTSAPDITGALEPDSDVSGYLSVGAAQVAFSAGATEKIETAALRVAKQVATSPDRARVVGCTPTMAKGDTCLDGFLGRLGQRAWRRPLAPEELARLSSVANTAAQATMDPWVGVEYALAALLQSPHFLYRVEIGVPDPKDPARRNLTAWELASRLSFFLLASIPDEALLLSASSGKLTDPQELRVQTLRLLDTPRARLAFSTLIDEVFRLDAVNELKQLPAVYPLVSSTIGPAMRTETLKLFEDVVFTRNADARDVLDGRRTFVNRELAKLYGLPMPSSTTFVEVELPDTGQRRGLLGHASVLATTSHASSSSPTIRGKFVREVLLCQTVPPPPPDISTDLPEDKATGPRTMREKLAAHSQLPACASCHRMTDPIGLGLETFDGLGAFRTMDAGKVIDASGTLDGVPFEDARELARVIRNHPNAAPCLTRHLFRYALGFIESDGQTAALTELDQAFAKEGYRLRALIVALTGSAAFRSTGALQ